jgi:hypothetical protein
MVLHGILPTTCGTTRVYMRNNTFAHAEQHVQHVCRYMKFLICQAALSVATYFGVRHMVHFLIVRSGYAYLRCGVVLLKYYIAHIQPGALGNSESQGCMRWAGHT